MLGTKITSKIVTIRAEGADITPLLAMEWMKTFNFLTKKKYNWLEAVHQKEREFSENFQIYLRTQARTETGETKSKTDKPKNTKRRKKR